MHSAQVIKRQTRTYTCTHSHTTQHALQAVAMMRYINLRFTLQTHCSAGYCHYFSPLVPDPNILSKQTDTFQHPL